MFDFHGPRSWIGYVRYRTDSGSGFIYRRVESRRGIPTGILWHTPLRLRVARSSWPSSWTSKCRSPSASN